MQEQDRIEGPVHLTVRVDKVEAVQNPELLGKGDWMLRLLVDDREVWANERPIKVGKGQSVTVDKAGAGIELSETDNVIAVHVVATEKDALNPDDHARSDVVRLYRHMGFGRATGAQLHVRGEGTHLIVHVGVQAEAKAVV